MSKCYYVSGTIKSEEDWLHGKQNGISKYYYENGNMQAEQTYLDGERFGIPRAFKEDGVEDFGPFTRQLNHELETLKLHDKEKDKMIKIQQEDISILKGRISELEISHRRDITEVRGRLGRHDGEISGQSGRIGQLHGDIMGLRSQVSHLHSRIPEYIPG